MIGKNGFLEEEQINNAICSGEIAGESKIKSKIKSKNKSKNKNKNKNKNTCLKLETV